jgi:hypothetical protein
MIGIRFLKLCQFKSEYCFTGQMIILNLSIASFLNYLLFTYWCYTWIPYNV